MKRKIFWILFVLLILFVVPTVLAQAANPPINIGEVSAVRVIAFIAAGMALLFDYFPGLAGAYDKLSVSAKQLWAVGIAIVIVGVAFGLTCANIATTSLACTTTGALDAFTGVIYLVIIQYGFHQATKPTPEFKAEILKIEPTVKSAPA